MISLKEYILLCFRIIECPLVLWVNYKRFAFFCLTTDRPALKSTMISICFSSVGPASQLIFRFFCFFVGDDVKEKKPDPSIYKTASKVVFNDLKTSLDI